MEGVFMIKKLTQKSILALLAFALAFLLIGSLTFVRPYAATDVSNIAPFYDNPYNPNVSTMTKNSDGSYDVDMNAGGGGARLLYGSYVSGVEYTPYVADLTDFSMTFAIDRLDASNTMQIGFLSVYDLGAYPMNGYGEGFSLNMVNDPNNGVSDNTGFCPTLYVHSLDGSTTTDEQPKDLPWHVYNNASPRTSYLGKKMTLHIFVGQVEGVGDVLNVDIAWESDGTNAAVNFSGYIPLANLPSNYNYKQAQLMFTANNSNGFSMTIYDITDPISNQYYQQFGGKLNNSIKATVDYVAEVNSFETAEITAEKVKNFYSQKATYENFNTSLLRRCDLNEYNAARALSLDSVNAKSVAIADQVFASYTAEGEITDLEDALKVYYFYLNNSEQLADYEAIVSNIRSALSTQDFGQVAVVAEIEDILSDYAQFDDSKYVESKARYDAVKSSYQSLSLIAKDISKDKLAELDAWFVTAYNSYYVTTGTYFSTYFNEVVDNNHLGELRNNPARATRNTDGTTSILLPASSSFILSYGNDDLQDYKFSLSNFSMTFSLDSVPTNARFAINFATERSAMPCQQNKTPGLTVMFRSDWSTNQLSVSLSKTIALLGEYPNGDEVSGIQSYGIIGLIGSSEGRYTEDVTIKFEAEGENYKLTVSMGASSASTTLTKAFMDSIFVDVDNHNQTVDYSKVAMNFTVGEGLTPAAAGDIALTVKSINDDYFRSVTQIKNDITAFAEQVQTLKEKDTLTIQEITSFNNNTAKIQSDVDSLRVYEKQDCNTLLTAISEDDFNAINAKAAAFVSAKLDAVQVSVDNFAEVDETLTAIEGYWAVLSAEQKALYTDYETKLAACKADVTGCSAAKEVIDDIAALVAKTLLPSNIDAIKAERDTVKTAYDALGAYTAKVTNYEAFTAYSSALDAYDPAVSVVDAINALFTTYENLSGSNVNAAKQAVADVKAAYDELTDSQKEDVTNYAKIAEFEAKIAAYEQYVIDYATAANVVEAIETLATTYATVNADNREACVAALAQIATDYADLTNAQKAMVENYAKVAEVQAKVDAYDAEIAADAAATQAANAVIAKIDAIGTVAYTDDCKTKIDDARSAYDALNDAAKAKVTNLSTLTAAEDTYAQLKAADDAAKAEKGGCGSSVYAYSVLGAVIVMAGAVALLAKKKNEI